MRAVLPRTESESTVEGGVYEVNESFTNLPELSRIVRQTLMTWMADDTRTNVESAEAGKRAAIHTLGKITQDEPGLVRGQIKEPLLLSDLVPGTPVPEVSGIYFSFSCRGATSPNDNLLDQFAVESTSPGKVESIPQLLRDALDSLYEVKVLAKEDECDEPSDLAINNVEVVLREMFTLSPRPYDIYPMVGGEIAIDAGNDGRRLGVFCYPDGRMQYVGLLGTDSEEVRQDSVSSIPVEFLRRFLSQPDP